MLTSRNHQTSSVRRRRPTSPVTASIVLVCAILLTPNRDVSAQLEYEQAPINYETAPVNDPVARLQQRLADGTATLEWDDEHGWLKSVLNGARVFKDKPATVPHHAEPSARVVFQ